MSSGNSPLSGPLFWAPFEHPSSASGKSKLPKGPAPLSWAAFSTLRAGASIQLTPQGEAALVSVQGQEELIPTMVYCKAATRRCKSKQTSQLLLQSCPRKAAKRIPGWWEGKEQGGCSGSGRCSCSRYQDFSAPCLATACQLTQKSSSGQGGAG